MLITLCLVLSACSTNNSNIKNILVDDGDALIQVKSFVLKTNISIANNKNIEVYNSDNFKELDNYIYVSLLKYKISKNKITIIHDFSNINIKVIEVSQNQIDQLTKFKIKLEKLLEQNYYGRVEIYNTNESNIFSSDISASLYNPSSFSFIHTTSNKTNKNMEIFVEFLIDQNNNVIQKIHGIISEYNNYYYIDLSFPFKNNKEQVYQLESGFVLKTKVHQDNI